MVWFFGATNTQKVKAMWTVDMGKRQIKNGFIS